jgi:A/G-specific adenine glycosylase
VDRHDALARDTARRLSRWYRAHRRDLPWRRTQDPYAIWISEIMLQQTTVEVVETRWKRFLARFPSALDLAHAPERAVLAEWSGLGYYARARNLHRAARVIAARNEFPNTLQGLRELPGIGPYTAAAVASIAFGIPEAAVDGNVVRVLCRLRGLKLDPRAPRTLARLRYEAQALVPARGAGDHNQAVMELGALVCTPRAPRCGACPLRTLCKAAASGKPEGFPRRPRPAKPRSIHLVAGVVERRKKVLLVEDEYMVRGHLSIPMFPVRDGERPANVLRKGWIRIARHAVSALRPVATLRHSVLDRRYLVSLFTFKEKSTVPQRRHQPEADKACRSFPAPFPPSKIRLLSPSQIARHPHGGFLLKVLAAWREHGR